MRTIINQTFATTLYVMLFLATGCAGTNKWPIRSTIDFASGFGDYRTGRFHAGLDLRTGGKVGVKVFSPVDGYVKRVKTSYFGYGKGLYVAGDDGRTYVFGHLDQYAPLIDKMVKEAQYRDQRYNQDLFFPKDSLRVRQGEFIALSGQTGAGAPHLHFETRTESDRPLNPQQQGYSVKDKVRPAFTRMGIELTDDRSLLPDGTRKRFLPLKSSGKSGNYVVDTIPYLNRPFGILVDCFDRMRADGMEQAVYRLRMFVDDSLWYESTFDTLDFATGQASYFEYDYVEAAGGSNRVRRLYRARGDEFSGSRAFNRANGILGPDTILQTGLHTVRVDAEDVAGNKSTLTFRYRQGPASSVMVFDSASAKIGDTIRYYFTKCKDFDRLGFDSIGVQLNQSSRWAPAVDATEIRLEGEHLVVTVVARLQVNAVLALSYLAKGKGAYLDQPFNGIRNRQAVRMYLDWEVIDAGLLVTVNSDERFAIWPKINLYYQGQLLGTERPAQYFNMEQYLVLIPPRDKYVRVDRIGLVADPDSLYPPLDTSSLNLAVVGINPADTLVFDARAKVTFTKEALFFPKFVGVKVNKLSSPARLGLASDHYQVLPESFVMRKGYQLQVELPVKTSTNPLVGLCWLNTQADRWAWLGDNKNQNDVVTASVSNGGSLAAVLDVEKPYVGAFSVPPRSIISDRQPLISFTVRDTLSGLSDDTSIVILLDKKWMIPEYDPELQLCRFQPPEPLSLGEHHVAVTARDRAGNKTEQFVIFTVIEGRKPVGASPSGTPAKTGGGK